MTQRDKRKGKRNYQAKFYLERGVVQLFGLVLLAFFFSLVQLLQTTVIFMRNQQGA